MEIQPGDTVLSHTPDHNYAFDLQGRLTYANRALLTLWRRPLEQAVGKSFGELDYPSELAGRLERQVRKVIETRQPVWDRMSYAGPAGEARDYEYILVPVLGADGEVQAVSGSTRDVTESRLAEERERAQQAQILDNERLESLGMMAGGIAHDFNNLLTGILGNASILAQTAREKDRPIAGDIVLAAERAAQLTRQMLAYTGRSFFRLELFDLDTLVWEALLSAPLSANVGVNLSFRSGACFIEADRAQMRQVLLNLLINASEAIGDGTGEISIRTMLVERPDFVLSARLHATVAAGSYVLLEVQDSGAGMTAETLKRIFDPFFTTKFTGRGLGLAFVQGMVKGHHGNIEVESRSGEGSTFRIYLPLARPAGCSHAASAG